ncbi:membrane protease YdiL (CAAX protease family) [Kibdelosporangium banguiense]|uniref:Membrane protease YdiL (CAAX protease family) n=1 Tax=Kibdelosporangium banguiense TaxID=1365924 RepID=A0ABS4TSN6_9PSEU|nr:type II CAAX endopeptidase family protein [Kibdelosporangium banguiense]MBP2327009.1 membrane protease YdiL (CAAX protease family) [Kibdelosporangium banguiense]
MARTNRLTDAAQQARLRRFRFPVLAVAFFVVMVANAGINRLVSPVALLALPVGIGAAVAIVAGYRRLSRIVEQRTDVTEVGKRGMWPGLLRGALIGSGLFAVLILVIAMFGGWQDVSWGSVGGFIATAGTTASVAVIEEVLFRGIVFRIMEEHLGTVITLVACSVLFGLVHLVNVNATLWGAISIGLTGGAMTGSAYVATRSLWMPIGMHFAWNFMHAGVFGVALSGSAEPPHGLLHTTLSGPSALTGGTFGPEASLLTMLVCVIPTVLLLRCAVRDGQILPRRRRAEA